MKRFVCLCCVFMFVLLTITTISVAQDRLRMSTTTSTDNSGLLDVLLPPFEEAFRVKVDVIAVGTGKALALGANGDVDVVFVHARAAEDKFVADGFGVNRRDVMYNDFIIVGPEDDPAKVKEAKSAAEAFKKIAQAQAQFISRGDDSGTHKKEKIIWKEAGMTPEGKWYQEAGQGMGAVLTMSNDKQAYTLADRGTYLAFSEKINLKVLLEGDPILYNPYGIIAVNPAKFSHVNYTMAMALIGWVTSPQGQHIIKEFGGKIILSVRAEMPVVSEEYWDHFVTFRYPSMEAYKEKLGELLLLGLSQVKIQEALLLYKRGLVSLGRAAELSGISERDMIRQARAADIEPAWSASQVEEELA